MTMKIMKSGRFNSTPAAMELLVSCAISFASSAEAAQLILGWYNTGNVTDQQGAPIEGTEINVQVRHTLVKSIFTSKHIDIEVKEACLTKLAEFDTSDMLGRTTKYCEGANPDPIKKREAFIALFENQNDMTLQHV